MGDACTHQHGGTVPGVPGWVCGQCWQVLSDRPTRYGMRPTPGYGGYRGSVPTHRQEVIWRAEERTSAEGLTIGQFLVALAQRFAVRGRLSRAEAMDHALTTMRSLTEMDAVGEFADPASEWSRASATDIADEEMSYWDHDGDGKNA